MKKQYLFTAIFLFLINCFVNAQDIEKDIKNKIESLHHLNIDTVVFYQEYCSSKPPFLIVPGDTAKCQAIYISYLFWSNKGQVYIQRFDECYKYAPIGINDDSLMLIVKQHFSILEKEIIKPVQVKEVNKKGKIVIVDIITDHSCTADFVFYTGKKIVKKAVNDFSLNTKDFGSSRAVNINYQHNQNTYLKRLSAIAKKETDVLYTQKY